MVNNMNVEQLKQNEEELEILNSKIRDLEAQKRQLHLEHTLRIGGVKFTIKPDECLHFGTSKLCRDDAFDLSGFILNSFKETKKSTKPIEPDVVVDLPIRKPK